MELHDATVSRWANLDKVIFNKILSTIFLGALLAILLMPMELCSPAYAQEPEPECWAVIVGVPAQQFSDKGFIDAEGNTYFQRTEYPDDDARDLYRELVSVWDEDHIKLLLNEEATKVDIYYAIKWLADNAASDDTVLFCFSGHGNLGTLAAYDICISDTELDSWLARLDSERIVIMLDMCFAGSFSRELGKDGRVVLMSCQQDESSFEDPELRHGVFTHYILQAINNFEAADINGDYELSAEELFNYAEPRTADEIIKIYANEPAIKDRQHPILYDPHYSSELSLLIKVIFYSNAYFPTDTTALTVDGRQYLPGELPPSFTLAAGPAHNFNVPSQIDTGKGTRLVFTSWDDGDISASRTISHGGEYTANYKTQYQLTIESTYGDYTAEGWYDSGSTANISTSSPHGKIIRQVFTGWSGDSTGTEATAAVLMDAPKTVTANWRTDYTRLYILIAGAMAFVGAAITTYILWRRKST